MTPSGGGAAAPSGVWRRQRGHQATNARLKKLSGAAVANAEESSVSQLCLLTLNKLFVSVVLVV